jgi:hypothetical protein
MAHTITSPALVTPGPLEKSKSIDGSNNTNSHVLVQVLGWRQCQRKCLLGFVTVRIKPPGLVIDGIAVTLNRWVSLPAKPLLMENGEPKRKPGSDKVEHVNLLKFDRYANRWFTRTLLIALDEFLAANHLTLPNPKDH